MLLRSVNPLMDFTGGRNTNAWNAGNTRKTIFVRKLKQTKTIICFSSKYCLQTRRWSLLANLTDAHAQYFVTNDVLLLHILKTFTSALSHYTLFELRDVFSLCVVVEESVTRTSSSPVAPPPPLWAAVFLAARDRLFLPRGSSRGLWPVPWLWWRQKNL
jgi:hypothetical protein